VIRKAVNSVNRYTKSNSNLWEPIDEIKDGLWRITVTIRADDFRAEWYLTLDFVSPDQFVWSTPTKQRPANWV
jgi:hypothetical protein